MNYAALLRGINVGGNRILPMKDLALIFSKLGCNKVRTYIQSGNAVFDAPEAVAKGLAAAASKAIHAKFGFQVPITLRSLPELTTIARRNPFLKPATDTETLHVSFLADKPAPALLKALANPGIDGEKFEIRGREIYLYLPKGMAKTKLTNAYFDAKLKTISTVRNWRTVLTLLQWAQGEER